MKKLFYSFFLLLIVIAAQAQTPAITMTTTNVVGSNFSFEVAAIANNTNIQVDWGNGTLNNFVIGTVHSSISGALAGSTLKIYGVGISDLSVYAKRLTSLDVSMSTTLTYLECSLNQLTALDLSMNTALETVWCRDNKITNLDVSKSSALSTLICNTNLLTSLDVSKNTELYHLSCGRNQLTALDLSTNTKIESLECTLNPLTFTTLPIKQLTWISYAYSPQNALKLPKNKYSTNEEIDLSSQLTVSGNTTNYIWKTISGATLVKNLDYTELNGKFTFLAAQGDYLVCNMTNASFPNLTLTTETISVTNTTPVVTMVTTSAIGSTFSFSIGANTSSNPFQVDWGNGILSNYTVGSVVPLDVTNTLMGNTIKIYGVGISRLYLQSKNLTALDITSAIALTEIDCYSNKLTTLDVSKNIALQEVECSNNEISTLDISNSMSLTYIGCGANKITTLDISKNIELTSIYCDYNQLSTIDVSKHTKLKSLRCARNNITTIDVSKNTDLTYLSCGGNRLTTIDVSKNTKLKDFDCSDNEIASLDISMNTLLTGLQCVLNKLNTLDVSKNTAIIYFHCYSNQLTALDVSKNTALKNLFCYSNRLTIGSLPIKQSTWANYGYSPQADYKLPKTKYVVTEDIDLSSQFTANSNTTTYVWKTKSGTILTPNVDYKEISGVCTFLKLQSDSVYCQMTNATFPELTLKTKAIAIGLPAPITMTTTKGIGSTFSFQTAAAADNTTILVDWGDAVLTAYTINTLSSTVAGALAGSNIKIYGMDISYLYLGANNLTALDISGGTNLKSLFCHSNYLTSLDISNNTALNELQCKDNQLAALDLSNNIALEYLWCNDNLLTTLNLSKNKELKMLFCNNNQIATLDVLNNTALTDLSCDQNQLTIGTLPIKQSTWTSYTYSPQKALKLPKKNYTISETLDLSNQLTASGNTTTYAWKTKGGTALVLGVDYAETNGVFTFLKVQADSVFCQMTNATFPDLTLSTETIAVSYTISITTTTAVGTTFSFELGASTDNSPIQVDWGNGTLTSYTIGTSNSISSTLTGNTIKIFGSNISNLNVYNKNLTSLDVSNNTELTFLNCSTNQLSTLDISKNTALTELSCDNNELTALDLSKNILLTKLYCNINQLTALDVSQSSTLSYLDCSFNQLTMLDVSNNTTLIQLRCNNNQLTELSLSKSINLMMLRCEENKLTALDISNNTTLTELDCSLNQLTLLDVSKNIALTNINCANNSMAALDLSKNTSLIELVCENDQLTVLDVSTNTALKKLYCDSNQLSVLDISKNTALTHLGCSLNRLKFNTLPANQSSWAYYNYSPQKQIPLQKKSYVVSETIDISNQLTISSITTDYIWKTKGGATLVSGSDYSITSGVTTFLKVQADSVFCMMTNSNFPLLTLETEKVKITTHTTSVDEAKMQVNIYPNPIKENLNIDLEENITRVEIYTLTGVKVYEMTGKNTNSAIISAENLPKGMLIVKVFGKNGVIEKKIVKEY